MTEFERATLLKRDGESPLAYHKRILKAKLEDRILPSVSYSDLAQPLYGRDYAEDVCRRLAYGSYHTAKLVDEDAVHRAENGDGEYCAPEVGERIIELQKERQRYFDQRTAYSKIVREQARWEELRDIIGRTIESGGLPVLESDVKAVVPGGCDLLVSMNDIHYGSVVDNYWHKYDSAICTEMMGRYIERVVEIGRKHGAENCIVWANGDMISGNIHRAIAVSNKENVIEQVMGVAELLSQAVALLSEHFACVRFVSVAGNHSRIAKKDDAIMQERLDDLVEWYMAARLANVANVVIDTESRIDSTMYAMDIRGKTYVGVHGDYDATAASVQTLQTMVQKPVYAVLSGHMHHNKIETVQGIKAVMAGSFQGMDDYCVQRRIFGRPEQIVCVCDESGIVCSYDVDLSLARE